MTTNQALMIVRNHGAYSRAEVRAAALLILSSLDENLSEEDILQASLVL